MPAFIQLHWATIAMWLGIVSASSTVLNRMIPVDKGPKWMHMLIDWAAAWPKANMTGLFGLPINIPYLTVSKESDNGKSPLPPVIKRLLFAAMVSQVAACACWQPQHAMEKGCVVAHQVVDCTKNEIAAILPAVLPIIGSYVSGGTADWNSILSSLEAGGFQNAGCILAALEADFASKPAAAKGKADEVRTAFSSWKVSHDVVGVKFKLNLNGKEIYE